MQNFAAPALGLASPPARRSLVLLCLLLQFFQCALLSRAVALAAPRLFPKADAKLHPFSFTTKLSILFSRILKGFNTVLWEQLSHCKQIRLTFLPSSVYAIAFYQLHLRCRISFSVSLTKFPALSYTYYFRVYIAVFSDRNTVYTI